MIRSSTSIAASHCWAARSSSAVFSCLVTAMAGPCVPDLRSRIVPLNSGFDERGLLGLALHPRFSENGLFYVIYNAPGRDSIDSVLTLSEFFVPDNADVAGSSSERVLLTIDKPQSNHNGGQLAFGPDGYLYFSAGDGGGVADSGASRAWCCRW